MSEVTQADKMAAMRVRQEPVYCMSLLEDHFARHRIAAEQAQAATIENLRETLEQIREHCGNDGFGNTIVNERIVDRCDETAFNALQALKETSEHRSKDDGTV